MGKHTIGPWRHSRWRGVTGPNGERILVEGVSLPTGNHPDIAEAIANARLIAAAPDLLAAAQRILSWYPEEVIASCTENSDQGWQDLGALRDAVIRATEATDE